MKKSNYTSHITTGMIVFVFSIAAVNTAQAGAKAIKGWGYCNPSLSGYSDDKKAYKVVTKTKSLDYSGKKRSTADKAYRKVLSAYRGKNKSYKERFNLCIKMRQSGKNYTVRSHLAEHKPKKYLLGMCKTNGYKIDRRTNVYQGSSYFDSRSKSWEAYTKLKDRKDGEYCVVRYKKVDNKGAASYLVTSRRAVKK